MDLEEIKELIAVMRKNKIKEIDLEQEGTRIRIVANDPKSRGSEKGSAAPVVSPVPVPYFLPPAGEAAARAPAQAPADAPEPQKSAAAEAPAEKAATVEEETAGVEIKSPMVGTFYMAPAPDAPPYVQVGSSVSPDTVVCIIEAMKLMNEIKSEVSGKILKALVRNGQPVEFGQPLFLVEPV